MNHCPYLNFKRNREICSSIYKTNLYVGIFLFFVHTLFGKIIIKVFFILTFKRRYVLSEAMNFTVDILPIYRV